LGVSEVRLEHPTGDHGETRSDRRFVGFQLRVFFPSVFPIEFVELQVGEGVISSSAFSALCMWRRWLYASLRFDQPLLLRWRD
jgi:hypothetical protein